MHDFLVEFITCFCVKIPFFPLCACVNFYIKKMIYHAWLHHRHAHILTSHQLITIGKISPSKYMLQRSEK